MMRRTLAWRRAGALAALALVSALAPALAQPARFVAGEHYRALEPRLPAARSAPVQVIEFFIYGCPHCYAFESQLQGWVAKLPEGVEFRRVPANFGAHGSDYARLYYTAKALGVLDAVHADIFTAIHERGMPLFKPKAARAFLVEHGVAGERFDAAYGSDAVAQDVAEAAALMRAYGVIAVPSLGIDGLWWTDPRSAGGYEAMLAVADTLIARRLAAPENSQPTPQ